MSTGYTSSVYSHRVALLQHQYSSISPRARFVQERRRGLLGISSSLYFHWQTRVLQANGDGACVVNEVCRVQMEMVYDHTMLFDCIHVRNVSNHYEDSCYVCTVGVLHVRINAPVPLSLRASVVICR